MDCRQTREVLSALVDNQIDETTKREAEEHIWRCATCRTEFELEKKTKDLIRTKVKLINIPQELVQNILTQIRTIQDGYESSVKFKTEPNQKVKPWLEIAFSVGVALVVISLSLVLVTVYENKMAQKEIIAKEVSGILSHFDSIANGLVKPEIISDDPSIITNQVYSKVEFTPWVMQIPNFKIVGASFNAQHSNSKVEKCLSLIYRSGDKLIFLHQVPLHRATIHDDVKKRISKGEWIYDTIGDDSFAIWGTGELLCCAVSNLSREELEKVLKQSW
ncbi:anti-sigma factor, TIGR02949 family [Candidatus Thermokryptus mobilis]|uniref:Anti-sigma factor, TIGR02949 family n=1 Tax=Candidatus Thermokryptus mobilis TaxID=1643428 RepID=A0A0S4NA78_9BACT|nr:zf-HC2 domain-containing protein [Candidatus Thermokryptus mobilis]CUU08116.1 anti-sigma factor, TIGR02949 family [Candidatus Thermokryptus mobilis]